MDFECHELVFNDFASGTRNGRSKNLTKCCFLCILINHSVVAESAVRKVDIVIIFDTLWPESSPVKTVSKCETRKTGNYTPIGVMQGGR